MWHREKTGTNGTQVKEGQSNTKINEKLTHRPERFAILQLYRR